MTDQPKADARCLACAHPGVDHLLLGDFPPHCRCGCVNWGESEYIGETADYQVGIRDLGDRWFVKFYSKRGCWGRSTWLAHQDGDAADEVAHRVAAEDLACPLA